VLKKLMFQKEQKLQHNILIFLEELNLILKFQQ
jgi:hypothetical protein